MPSERPSTVCSEPRRRSTRSCESCTRDRERRDLLLPGAARAAGPRRMDQPRRARLRVPAARRSRPPRPTASRRSTTCSRSSRAHSRVVHVCVDIACAVAGGPVEGEASPCLGLCEHAPAALVVEAGETPFAAPVHDGEWDAAGLGSPTGTRGSRAAGPRRRRRSALARLVRSARRLRRAAQGDRDRCAAVVDEVMRSGLGRSRRRGVPDRDGSGRPSQPRVDAALPRRQRRRERTRHVQGPRASSRTIPSPSSRR